MVVKILQINNFHYPRGGSDRYFLEITRLLRQEGHDARTFSSARPENVEKDWLVVSPPTGVDNEHVGGVANALHFLYSPEVKRQMREAVAIFQPDIAHLHIYYGQLTASILAPLRMAGVPIVQTLHEYKLVCPTHGLYARGKYCADCNGRHYWHALLKRCNRGSMARSVLSMMEAYVSEAFGARDYIDQFIAVSDFQKRQLVRLGVPEEKMTVLHHFADVISDAPTEEGKYFLYVGRILEDKGIGVLLEAYALLNKGRPPLKIVGDGVETERWRIYSNKLGITGEVEWLGFKDGDELDRLYRGSLAVINPSLLNETFGLTCLESLSRGRPVIASRVGAFPEVVSDGLDGILVNPGDPSSLAKGMEKLASRPYDALSMGIRGLEKVKNNFSRQRHYEALLKIYNRVINDR